MADKKPKHPNTQPQKTIDQGKLRPSDKIANNREKKRKKKG